MTPLGTPMVASLPNLRQILENHRIHKDNIYDLQQSQQNDGFNCGPYTVLNLDSLARHEKLLKISAQTIKAQRKNLATIKAALNQEEQEVLTVPDKQIKASYRKIDMKKQSSANLYNNEGDTPFMKQLDNYYSGMIIKLNNLNKEEFIDQFGKLEAALISILENSNNDKGVYPFSAMENLVRESIKETLQKHIVNILTYQVLKWKEYNEEYSATAEDIKRADKKIRFSDGDNANRIVRYKDYLIRNNFIPQSFQDSIFDMNNEEQEQHNSNYNDWNRTPDSDSYDEDNGNTPPPEPYEWIKANSAEAFKHPVFRNPNNLQYLIEYCKDAKEGIGWLIAEYAENIFDSDEAILNIINQNSEDIDSAISELIFGSLYFYRDYDHEAVLKFFSDETKVGYGWLVGAYLTGLKNIKKEGFEQFVQKLIERLTEHYAIVVNSLAEEFQENIDAYNKAYLEYNLITMQKAWYVFSQKQKIYIAAHQKDYTSKTSISSFEKATNKVLEKVDKEFLSIFPAELKLMFYSSKNSNKAPKLDVETEFKQLATLGQTIKRKMLENNSKTFASTNVVVAELVFVCSSEPYQKDNTQ